MFAKIAVLACVLAVGSAGFLEGGAATYESYAEPAYASYSAPALTAASDNVYRSAGNLQSISTHSKSISTPYSSSNKHDIRITNPGVYAHATPAIASYAHSAPIAHATYAAAAPIAHASYAAPAPSHTTYTATPLSAAPLAHSAYAAAAPVAHAGLATNYGGYATDLGHSGLTLGYAAGHGYGARSAHPSSLIGVAYSPAVAVSHMSYSSPVGINYSW